MATDVWQVHADDAVDQRRAGRHEVAVSRASMRGLGQAPADAVLLDISIYGCRVAYTGERTAGDRLWLRLDGGWPIPATAVWTDGEKMGCRFDQPIAGSVMRDLIREPK